MGWLVHHLLSHPAFQCGRPFFGELILCEGKRGLLILLIFHSEMCLISTIVVLMPAVITLRDVIFELVQLHCCPQNLLRALLLELFRLKWMVRLESFRRYEEVMIAIDRMYCFCRLRLRCFQRHCLHSRNCRLVQPVFALLIRL